MNTKHNHKEITALIFDLDGTVLYTLEDIAQAVNEVLSFFGYPEHPTESYRQFVGSGLRNTLQSALPQGISVEEALYDRLLSVYRAQPCRHARPYQGIRPLLRYLQNRRMPMAILSNKDDVITKAAVKTALPEFSFTAVLGQQEAFPKKPHPASAIHIARLMGVQPHNVLFVGDSEIDYSTALAAKMIPAVVTWGYRSRSQLQREVPDGAIITHVTQLYDIIGL
ncbi:MAG: HAD family hydrolase [Spirochaetota bacterium]